MRFWNGKTRTPRGLTLVEMVIAIAIMVVVFAVIAPQLRAIRNSWDSKEAGAETLQNARVLTDHLSRNLARAVRITAVSAPDEIAGYIEFEDNDGNNLRYEIDASNYVEFGVVGDLYELAGPVSQLQFTCYDGNDFDNPTTDVNSIRFVEVQTTLTNPAALGQNKTFTAQAYLRTNLQDEAGWTLYKVAGSEIEFETSKLLNPALSQIDATHYLCAYQGDGDDGWAVVLTVNTSNWTITKETSFEFDTGNGRTPALYQIDSTHYLCAYEGDGSDGWATVLTVNTGTWNISKETPFEFDQQKGKAPALAQIDDNHFLCAYQGDGDDGWAVVLTVDTGTWTISAETPFEFDTENGETPALSKIDDKYYLCAYEGGGDDGWAVVLKVAGSYAISAETPFEFDTKKGIGPALAQIDSDHYLCAYQGDGDDGWAVVLKVNPSNKIVTKETSLEFDPSKGKYMALAKMSDDEHYLCAYSGAGDDGWGIVLNVQEAPWTITADSSVEYDTSKAADVTLCKVDDTHYLCVYRGDGDDGYAAIIWSGDTIRP